MSLAEEQSMDLDSQAFVRFDKVQNCRGIILVHANFSLKTSLLFYRSKLFSKNYHIHTCGSLEKLKSRLDSMVFQFVDNKLPIEIKMHDAKDQEEEKEMKVSDYKVIKKEVIRSEDERYKDFDVETAEQSTVFMKKHIYEFQRGPDDDIPEIFTLLFHYFD